ncbi:carbonic anhydrase 13-like [Porites lutea]|uniref:carbonic anhydrase 13-like n=1 Tax=Porites lutea TaxID=51062 RepID=UPI003CC61FF8
MVSIIKLLVLFTTIGAVYSEGERNLIWYAKCNLLKNLEIWEIHDRFLRIVDPKEAFKKVKGPEDWHDLKLNKTNQCGGNRQSPINIKTSEVEEEDSYRRLKIAFDNTRGLVTGTLENTGHSPELIIADSNGASLTGGPLGNNKFELIQFHVHFGCVNERGSEHKLNGKQLSGELHMVFGHDEEPRVVVAVWIKAASKGNKIFGKLANLMHHIIKPGRCFRETISEEYKNSQNPSPSSSYYLIVIP